MRTARSRRGTRAPHTLNAAPRERFPSANRVSSATCPSRSSAAAQRAATSSNQTRVPPSRSTPHRSLASLRGADRSPRRVGWHRAGRVWSRCPVGDLDTHRVFANRPHAKLDLASSRRRLSGPERGRVFDTSSETSRVSTSRLSGGAVLSSENPMIAARASDGACGERSKLTRSVDRSFEARDAAGSSRTISLGRVRREVLRRLPSGGEPRWPARASSGRA